MGTQIQKTIGSSLAKVLGTEVYRSTLEVSSLFGTVSERRTLSTLRAVLDLPFAIFSSRYTKARKCFSYCELM